MIKIFDANDRDFSTAGNIIIEPIKCNEIKRKSLNGWYLEVEVPIKYNDYIVKDKLCVVKTKSKLNPQAFRIGEEIERSTRRIKFKAEHVMFDARDYVLLDVRPTNMNGLNALNYINDRTDKTSPFTMYSNVENTNTAYFIRRNLLEAWEIIEERWGGVFDADNWDISFLSSVGHDNGETIAYGKNLQGFDNYEDWSSVCTKLYPVGYDGIMLPEKFIEADIQYEKPYTRVISFETNLDSEEQTEANLITELRNKAQEYIEENKVPKVSYTIISNINGDLEIGDTVQVLHPFVNIFTEVLEYEYNLISKKVLSLTFGNYSRDVKTKFDNIKNTINQITEAVSKQEVVINNQTNIINSLNKNGYVYIDDNEILILDSLPKESAHNVWRFGLGGIGFSSNGYEGPFEVAMTMDGQINANFITTGTLSVARIEGLANFISETNSQLAQIEVNADNIAALVDTTEQIEREFETLQDVDGQAEGKYIYLDDASDELITSAKFNGETSQATRESSRNIFNKNAEINKSMNAASKTTLNTGVRVIADSGRAYNASVSVVMKLGNTTDLVGKTIRVKTTATPSANNLIPSLGIAIYSNDYSSATGLRKVSLNAGETGTLELTYTVSQNNNPNVGIVLYLTDSSTTSAGDYTDFENLMVTVDDEDMTYEPYGAMPSPDYPSEIINLKGKNLFNKNSVELNKAISATGEVVSSSGSVTSSLIKIEPNTEYRLTHMRGSYYVRTAAFYKYNNEFISYIGISGQEDVNGTITTPDNAYYMRVVSGSNYYENCQVEKGNIPSEIVPFNSLQTKIINKNIFNKNRTQLGSNVTKTVLDTGVRVTTKVAGNARYCGIEIGKDELLGKKVTISANIAVSGTNNGAARLFFGKYNTPSTSGIGTALTSTGSNTVTIPNTFYSGTDRIYLLLYSNVNGDTSIDNYVDYTNLQVEIGEEATEYEEYKEQIVYFPLEDGQKLYKGSYPADDGIHNTRKQIVFDGSSDENWIKGSYPITGTVQMQIQKPANFFTETGATAVAKLNCSHFKSENQVVNGMALGGMFNVYPSTDLNITTAAEFKTWLSNNPMTLEYPLAEEEIIPYNTEQQAAWNNIMQLHTYKTVTHIYSDAYAEIGYIKDNMLSAFETKASARLTQQDVQQLKIENGRISSEVSSTQSQLNNYYTKNEADNNTNSTKAELQNIIQQNKTEIEQTTQEIALRVSSIETNGVDKIETSMGYTFDNNGLNIDKEGAATASTIDNEAFKVKNKSTNENVFFAGYVSDQDSAYRGQTIVESTNLVVKNYLNIEGASRFQPYVNPVLGGHGTGAFDIG